MTDRLMTKEEVLDYYLRNGIHTDDELHKFVHLFLGFNVPRKRFCPNHAAPFELIADMFFCRTENAIGFANRSGGKTRNVAILNFLNMLFYPECDIVTLGATLKQTKLGFSYLMEHFYHDEFRKFLIKDTQQLTSLINGSSIQTTPATLAGVNAWHLSKVVIDEAEMISWVLIQQAFSIAKTKLTSFGNKIISQYAIFSTRKFAYGTMQKLLDTATKRNIKVYQWCVWEVLEKCKRKCENDPVYGDCPVYHRCEGKAHNCEGYYFISDFIKEVALLDSEVFETEWLNLRPQRTGLVYPAFNPDIHVWTWERFKKETSFETIPKGWRKYRAIDFGYKDPWVRLCVAEDPMNRLYIYKERYKSYITNPKHAEQIRREDIEQFEWTVADSSGANERQELHERGIRTIGSKGRRNDKTSMVRGVLEKMPDGIPGVILIAEETPNMQLEFTAYHYPDHKEGHSISDNPVKENDHTMNAFEDFLERWTLVKRRAAQVQSRQEAEKEGLTSGIF